MQGHRQRRLLLSLALALAVLAGCGPGEIGTYLEGAPPVSPTAIAALPDDIEEAELIVANGSFGVEDLFLLEGAPTILHVANSDERDYEFRIVEDLVAPYPIAANAVTDIEFTTPNADVYEGLLLSDDGEDVLDTVRVIVRSAGGVEP